MVIEKEVLNNFGIFPTILSRVQWFTKIMAKCSHRWLKPTRNLVRQLKPAEVQTFKMPLGTDIFSRSSLKPLKNKKDQFSKWSWVANCGWCYRSQFTHVKLFQILNDAEIFLTNVSTQSGTFMNSLFCTSVYFIATLDRRFGTWKSSMLPVFLLTKKVK